MHTSICIYGFKEDLKIEKGYIERSEICPSSADGKSSRFSLSARGRPLALKNLSPYGREEIFPSAFLL
jgi:hypothetical protein